MIHAFLPLTVYAHFAILLTNIEIEKYADTEKATAYHVSAFSVSPREGAMPANYITVRKINRV